MYDIENFKIIYKSIDKRDSHVIGCFDNIDDLIDQTEVYCISHRGYRFGVLYQNHNKSDTVSIKSYDYKSISYIIPDPKPKYWYAPYSNREAVYHNVEGVYVTNNLGDIIDNIWTMKTRGSYNYKNGWAARLARNERVHKELVRYKNNVNKIKDIYAYHLGYNNYYGAAEWDSSNIIGCFRAIHTNTTLRKLTGYIKEEGEPEPRGNQRCLPTSYDDVYCNVYKQHKSWKHNSKRRKQWKNHTNANL